MLACWLMFLFCGFAGLCTSVRRLSFFGSWSRNTGWRWGYFDLLSACILNLLLYSVSRSIVSEINSIIRHILHTTAAYDYMSPFAGILAPVRKILRPRTYCKFHIPLRSFTQKTMNFFGELHLMFLLFASKLQERDDYALELAMADEWAMWHMQPL